MSSILCLSKGGTFVSKERLKEIVVPNETASWKPISPFDATEMVESYLQTSFEITEAKYAINKKDQQFFATYDLASMVQEGVAVSVGLRGSIDKTLSHGLVAGTRVFICDNLAFSSEITIFKKHTVNGFATFREAVIEAMPRLDTFITTEKVKFERWQDKMLYQKEEDSFILTCYEKGILPVRCLKTAVQIIRKDHERTVWYAYNAVTEALKPLQERNGRELANKTIQLGVLADRLAA